MSNFAPRLIESQIRAALARGKSVLLIGARQTGKTTIVEQHIQPAMTYSFAQVETRQRYENDPVRLEKELTARCREYKEPPLIFIDEVQKIPSVMDMVQHLIDHKLGQFILSGSSARKLRHGSNVNLLPGRVVVLSMVPLLYREIPDPKPDINELLLYGTLPSIITEDNQDDREQDLLSYVSTYLEEEVRAEAAVRSMGHFSRFLQLAAGEAGTSLNFARLSQDIGVAASTIANYFQLLEDCLIVERIDPIIKSASKRRLIRAPKYLFFDLGVRRAVANEGRRLSDQTMGSLFEHFVGNELLNQAALASPQIKLRYWKDAAGPEVDYVLDCAQHYIPIEVKWTDKPRKHDARHLLKMQEEYGLSQGYIVCRTPQRYELCDGVMAIPWWEIQEIIEDCMKLLS